MNEKDLHVFFDAFNLNIPIDLESFSTTLDKKQILVEILLSELSRY